MQRDLHERFAALLAGMQLNPVSGEARFCSEGGWSPCSKEHVTMVLSNPDEYQDYQVRYLYAAPPAPVAPEYIERTAYETFVAEKFGDSVDRRLARNGDKEYMAWDMVFGWEVWKQRAEMHQLPGNSEHTNETYRFNSLVIPTGWKLAPIVPTIDQLAAGRKELLLSSEMSNLLAQLLGNIYRSMVTTATDYQEMTGSIPCPEMKP